MSQLALLGGTPVLPEAAPEALFHWPIVTKEDEDAVLEVLRRGAMSATDVTVQFEREFAKWQKLDRALGFCNGTAAIQTAMFAVGVGEGDEIICPSVSYWACCIQAYSLGATPVFADINLDTLTIEPADIERLIGPRTKAIMAVHYLGHPVDMDPVLEIAKRHNLRVIEDVSHAQGGYYKGRLLGTMGDLAVMSIMSGKSLATGEAGVLATSNREIYDRALAYAHYERFNEANVQTASLAPYYSVALGGIKGRMNQLSSAMGRVQLKYYDERTAEIRRAMNRFWDCLEGVPGLKAHRVDEKDGSTMAGWYAPHGLYRPKELGGLSVRRFAEAVQAEGVADCVAGCNMPLHTHNAFRTANLYHTERPTRIAHTERDVRTLDEHLPNSEIVGSLTYGIPWFKHDEKEWIERYAQAFRKVAEHYEELLPGDAPDERLIGQWYFYRDKDDKR